MKRLLAILLILIILIAVSAAPVSATGPSLHKAAGGGTAGALDYFLTISLTNQQWF
jgi:Spy/CpxP family protein refolding chaperone